MIQITVTAPTRVDLAGGTLDLWPLHHFIKNKATVNLAVDLEAKVDIAESQDGLFHIKSQDQRSSVSGGFHSICSSIEIPLIGNALSALWREDLPPLTIVTSAKSPIGAGIGGSSALLTALAAGLDRARTSLDSSTLMDEELLVRTVQDIETGLLKSPTGCQDHWAATRGGLNIITFPFGKTKIETIDPATLTNLADEIILCHSGQSRKSTGNNWQIYKRLCEGDNELLEAFSEVGKVAEKCAESAREGNTSQLLFHSSHEWNLRKTLWSDIETDETKRIDEAVVKAGALFSRVCGAGGGGVLAIFAPKELRSQITSAAVKAGGIVLKAGISKTGLVFS